MPDRLTLKSYEFRREREQTWRELEKLVDRVNRQGVRSLSAGQLARLPELYRATLSSLSVARTISLDRNLVDYLESLTGRAYFCVYGTKRHFFEALAAFFLRTFPRAVREIRWHLLTVSLVFLVGGAVGFVMTTQDEDRYYTFVDRQLAGERGPTSTRDELRDVLYGGDESPADWLVAFAAGLFHHNAGIGIMCFALGMMAGVPVFVLVFTNGLMLGAFTALHHNRGLGVDVWGWLLPHGITEIFAILLCGAAGLVLGQAVVFPGRSRRLSNAARRGRLAGSVALGAIVLFLAAGLIEGVFRQRVQSVPVRYAVALGSALAWLAYFTLVGRRRRP